MRKWLRVVVVVVVAAALAAAPRAVAQEDRARPAERGDAIGALLLGLGDPPRLDLVNALVRDPRMAVAATARQVAENLASRGGYAVAQGLVDLARHRDASVRFAALRGIAEVELRRADQLIWIRAALRDQDPLVRTAACEAIGRVGDASDLPLLLEGLASDDERARGAAGGAIAKLTGLNLPTGEVLRWNEWWTGAKSWIPAQLDRAIERIDAGGERADLRDARALLGQYAWFDVEKVQGAVAIWLRTLDARHRTEGYRVAAACRLGDLADDVRRAALDEDEPGVVAVALRACMKLGVASDGMKCPPTAPALVALLEKANDDASDDPDATLEEMVARITQPKAPTDPDAATRDGAQKTGHAGGTLGSAVWLDLEAKRAHWKTAAAGPDSGAPDHDASLASSSIPWIGIGLAFVAVTIAVAIARTLVRHRAELGLDTLPFLRRGAVADAAEPIAGDALAAELRYAGLDPESLAAAGVRMREIGRLVDAARQWTDGDRASSRKLSANQAAARETMRERLFDAATAALSTDSKAALHCIRENRIRHPLPVHYLVLERSDDDWSRLGDLLEYEAAATKRKEELAADVLAFLEDVRSDLAVKHARRNVNELLDGVSEAWENAVATPSSERTARPRPPAESSRLAVTARH